ncbi:MAG: cytochrome c oxidase subunit I, partial [Planctomycetota bacterium]
VLGRRGMPRRYATYDPEFATLHFWSTMGALLLGAGLLYALVTLLVSLVKGKRAPANPWGGATLEWHCTSPPPYYNFERPPVVGDPYDFHDIEWDAENERYVSTEPEREIAPAETPETVPAHAGGQK